MKFLKLKRVWLLLLFMAGYISISSCETSNVILQTAPIRPAERIASPPITAQSLAQWEREKPAFSQAIERDIYGSFPKPAILKSAEKKSLLSGIYKGQGRAENWTLTIEIPHEDGTQKIAQFNMAIILPKAEGPVPIITMQTFCPSHSTLPDLGVPELGSDFCEGDGFGAGLMLYVFGRYIGTPPIEDILARGYGIATMYPAELIPDHPNAGRAAMNELFGPSPLGPLHNASVIGGWAYMWAAAAEALANDEDIDRANITTFGHSRYGKSALLTALWSPHISAVASHQSGTGGASLSRNKKGETVSQITASYPHWFAPSYIKYDRDVAIEVDQHHLLALLAPTPILLGNARRDVWSDPEGAFHAARAADPIYKLYGTSGLTVEKLNKFDPAASLSYWIRKGTHGIVKEDWPAFLDFFDAHYVK